MLLNNFGGANSIKIMESMKQLIYIQQLGIIQKLNSGPRAMDLNIFMKEGKVPEILEVFTDMEHDMIAMNELLKANQTLNSTRKAKVILE